MTRTAMKPLYTLATPLELIRFFTPNWFAVTMGTGVLALGIAQVAVRGGWLHHFAQLLWQLNCILFILFSLCYTARWIIFPQQAARIFSHPQMSLFLGTIPMGLATIINGFLCFGIPLWGDIAIRIADSLWQLDVALAIACGICLPLMMFTRQSHSLDSMSGLWLLPLVAAEVAAASGWLLAPYLSDPIQQQHRIIFSMLLWAFSVPVAFSVLVILMLRMALHKLPPIAMAASSWLALGPIGTGALGMFLLSDESYSLLREGPLASYSVAVSGLAWGIGIMLWGFGAWWLLMATGITLHYAKQGIPFNLGWWGYTFPLGVFILATFKLAATTSMTFFSDISIVLLIFLGVIWLIVMTKTLIGAWSGKLFSAPCLSSK